MALVVTPPQIDTVFACNPIVFSCSVEPEDAILTIIVDIWDYTHSVKIVSANYSVYNNECSFDLSGYIKNLFTSLGGLDYTSELIGSDTCINLSIDVYNEGGTIQNFPINAVYGVTQILEDDIISYASCDKKKFLTGFTNPKFWKSYPFTLSIIRDIVPVTDDVFGLFDAGSGDLYTLTGANTSVTVIHGNIGLLYNNNVANPLWSTYPKISCVLAENPVGKSWESEVKIIQLMNPTTAICTPVYLRWLNQFGGYDYYMFFKKDILKGTKSTTVNKFPLRLYASGGQHDGSRKIVSKSSSKTWVVSALNIPVDEYEELLKIYDSVKVDMWIPKTETIDGAFLGITLVEKSNTVPQDEVIMDIELELLMPETFTQR